MVTSIIKYWKRYRERFRERFGGGVEDLTIKDIAKACGVSVSTVSRVLNEHPDVSAANREKVLATVRAMHYVPNSSARDLVKGPDDAIGLVVRGVGNPFFTNIIRAVEEACDKAGYTMVLHQIHSGEDELAAGAQLAGAKRLRGLILLGGCFDYTPEDVARLKVPFVCCSYTNSFGTLRTDEYSSVSINDQKEAYKAVKMLAALGHQKIAALVHSVDDRSVSQLRFKGYCQALEDSGIALDRELVQESVGYYMADGYRAMEALLDRRDDFTAIFVISDAMAIAAMKALHDRGKRVPEDCSVIAIDGIEVSAYTVPTLTTLIQPQREMGTRSVAILLDMIEGKAGNRHIQMDTDPRQGGSVRKV